MEQSPCPHRIIDDFGSAYLLGAVGSGAFHMIKGVRNSPKGFKFQGGIQNTALRAPTTGGAFALWGGMFATYDCSLAYIRRKEDSWNAMIAGGLTNSTLALRAGWKAAGKNFIVGFALLGLIEAMMPLMSKLADGGQESALLQNIEKKEAEEKKKKAANKINLRTDVNAETGSVLQATPATAAAVVAGKVPSTAGFNLFSGDLVVAKTSFGSSNYAFGSPGVEGRL